MDCYYPIFTPFFCIEFIKTDRKSKIKYGMRDKSCDRKFERMKANERASKKNNMYGLYRLHLLRFS